MRGGDAAIAHVHFRLAEAHLLKKRFRQVTQEMIDRWHKFLDLSQSLLRGPTPAPFWRGDGSRGVNLNKVFLEQRPLDVVLWVQGTAAAPHLEQGQITNPNTWRDIWNVFRGDSFLGYAAWFN